MKEEGYSLPHTQPRCLNNVQRGKGYYNIVNGDVVLTSNCIDAVRKGSTPLSRRVRFTVYHIFWAYAIFVSSFFSLIDFVFWSRAVFESTLISSMRLGQCLELVLCVSFGAFTLVEMTGRTSGPYENPFHYFPNVLFRNRWG